MCTLRDYVGLLSKYGDVVGHKVGRYVPMMPISDVVGVDGAGISHYSYVLMLVEAIAFGAIIVSNTRA